MKTKNILGGEYRVGLKSLYDLYPMKVREKLNSENKFKSWDDNQKKAMAEIHRELDVLDGKSSPGDYFIIACISFLKQELSNNEICCRQTNFIT